MLSDRHAQIYCVIIFVTISVFFKVNKNKLVLIFTISYYIILLYTTYRVYLATFYKNTTTARLYHRTVKSRHFTVGVCIKCTTRP